MNSVCPTVIDGAMTQYPPPGTEILTPAEMAEADRLTIQSGIPGPMLMEAAGQAIVSKVLETWPGIRRAVILCGPGNNGGDGYVAARLLKARSVPVALFRDVVPQPGTDAKRAADLWHGLFAPLPELDLKPGDVVIDALYGAGFKGTLKNGEAEAVETANRARLPILAVDLPSGLNGSTGHHEGPVIRAAQTVTFFRKKPCHLLLPGRDLCGSVSVADIGISPRVLPDIGIRLGENTPALFAGFMPNHSSQTHKYARGMIGIFSGGSASSGAARLAAAAAQRAGAGAVTLLAPDEAIPVIAAHVSSVMIRPVSKPHDCAPVLADQRFRAFLIGPGFGRFSMLKEFVLALLQTGAARPIVLDADVFSAFALEGETLFAAIKASGKLCVLTPHEGEFSRLFPDLAHSQIGKHERARVAAKRSGAVVILKGADTVIAAPDGRASINSNGGTELATAGSGDVLAGFAVGLLAQGMPAFEAACAAVWHHADAGIRLGHGLVAEELAAEIEPAQ